MPGPPTRRPAIAGAGLLVSVMLYSNFFAHGQGPIDSVMTYKHYLDRSGGHRGDVSHEHATGWYLSTLLFQSEPKPGTQDMSWSQRHTPWFSEAPLRSR